MPAREASPLAGRSLGELHYEGLQSPAFADRVTAYLEAHGVDHPRALLTPSTLPPLEQARRILQDEQIHGRTPKDWIALSKAESLLALEPQATQDASLADAVVALARAAGASYSDAQLAQLRADAGALDPALAQPLARLVSAVAIDYAAQARLADALAPRVASAEEALDMLLTPDERESSLARALDVVAASNAFRADVAGLPEGARAAFSDPLGLVVVGNTGNDAHAGTNVVLVDLGGADTYTGNAGGACPVAPSAAFHCNGLALAVAIDLAGDDSYGFEGPEAFVQGAGGFGGVGVLVDAQGSDAYYAHMWRTNDFSLDYVTGGAQGQGTAGVGVLVDALGDDLYRAEISSPTGRSMFDQMQGWGGVGGVAILADGSGNDRYHNVAHDSVLTPYNYMGVYTNGVAIYAGVGIQTDTGLGHDEYHSFNVASATDYYAQGFGAFGGLGILYEDGGDDSYIGSETPTGQPSSYVLNPLLNCAFGTASYGGVGILVDTGGNDVYFGETIAKPHNIPGRAAGGYVMNEGYGGPGAGYGLFVEVSGDDGHFMSAYGGDFASTSGRGVLVKGLGAGGFLPEPLNAGGTYLDLGGVDQYTGAPPSADNGVWVDGADVNLPFDLLG